MEPSEPPRIDSEEMEKIMGPWNEAVEKKMEEISSSDNRRLAIDLLTLEARTQWLEERVQALHSAVRLLKD